MSRTTILAALCLLFAAVCVVGCSWPSGQSSYVVNESGFLSLTVPPPAIEERVFESNQSLTLSAIRFRGVDADVYGLLAAPPQPTAAIVLVPGAGVKKEGHAERAKAYATQGCAVLVLDVRGNGGETAGYPMNIEEDYKRFQAGTWPQTYAIAADIVGCRKFLAERYHAPVYALGESNGGRYAILAAAADPEFAGVAGISTSGFGLAGAQYPGDAARFLLSIDPSHVVPMLAGRSIWIAHSKADSIIPYEDGVALYDRAAEPKHFIEFHGGHGINEEVDRILLEAWSRPA